MATEAPKPQDVSIILSTFDKISKGIDGLGSVASFAASLPNTINFLRGRTDADRIIEALNEMTARLEAKLQNLEITLEDNRKIDLSSRNRELLIHYKKRIMARLLEFKSYDQTQDKVQFAGDWVPIAVWCKPTFGVLAELYDILVDMDLILSTSTYETKNAIDEWDDLVKSKTVERALGIKGETRFTLMFEWYQSICMMVQSAVYIYNAALTYYWRTPATQVDKARDLSDARAPATLDFVLSQLGRMSYVGADGHKEPGTGVWLQFEKKFEEILGLAMYDDHDRQASFNSFNATGAHLATFSDDHRIRPGGFRLLAGANAYIAGLELGYDWHRQSNYDKCWQILATVVKLNDDGSHRVWREAVDGLVPIGDSTSAVSRSSTPLQISGAAVTLTAPRIDAAARYSGSGMSSRPQRRGRITAGPSSRAGPYRNSSEIRDCSFSAWNMR